MYIYYIYNEKENKGYVGLSLKPTIRWASHMSGEENSLISKAIQKFEVEAFTFKILQRAKTLTELKSLEKKWALKLNTIYPTGYNKVIPTESLETKLEEYFKTLTLEEIFLIERNPSIVYRSGKNKHPKLSVFCTKQSYDRHQSTFNSLLEEAEYKLLVERLNPKCIVIRRQYSSLDDQLIKAVRGKGYIVEGG